MVCLDKPNTKRNILTMRYSNPQLAAERLAKDLARQERKLASEKAYRVCRNWRCGKPLPQSMRADAEFCSDKCRMRAKRRSGFSGDRCCAHCGEPISFCGKGKAVYSEADLRRGMEAWGRSEESIRETLEEGRFDLRRSDTRYCSARCRVRASRKRAASA